jgi:general secretion pathway protein J
LIELLVGLSLMALLALLLFGGVHFGLRAWEAGGTRIERLNEAQQVQELLRRQLSQAYLLASSGSQAAAGSGASFRGTAGSLAFIAPLPSQAGTGGLYRFMLGTEVIAGERRLVLAWQVFRPDRPPRADFDESSRSVLLHAIAAVDFAYYGRWEEGRLPQWHGDWDDRRGLPELVRLRVNFPAGDGRAWPDLFIAPKLRGPGS